MHTNMDQDWHYTQETQNTVEEFHRSYASFPTTFMEKARSHLDNLISRLEEHLTQSRICSNLIHCVADDIKVASSPLEFDVAVVLENDNFISAEETGYRYLKLYTNAPSGSDAFKLHVKIMNQKTKTLLTDKTISILYSKLHLFLNKNDDLKKSIILRDHGTTVRMDVYRSKPGETDRANFFYSVNMVPSFDISRAMKGVTKPFPGQDVDRSEWRWLLTFKELGYPAWIDDNSQCQKECIQVIQVGL